MPDISIQEERLQWEGYASRLTLATGVSVEPETLGGVSCSWVRESGRSAAGVVLYVHGGGLISGSSITHREYASRLAQRLELDVLLVDYRLAPEHPFPAALQDMQAVYRELAQRIPVERIVVGGESSGAGLALALLVQLKRTGASLPRRAFFVSGHFDMTLGGDSMQSRVAIDPFTSREALERAVDFYTRGHDRSSPLISPLFADLSGLPPLLLQVGDHEMLLSDSVRLAEKVRVSGGQAELRVWDEMWHNWPMYPALPEADAAIDEVRAFLRPTRMTTLDHRAWMQRAIVEAERARGKTGDNPWVGCVLVDEQGQLLGAGHTQGPGEDHAEIGAFRQATERGFSFESATLYSTLEPCSFHGRTPACSRAIVERGVRRVVTGMRDPNPRVDGAGVRILEQGGIEVIEGICELEVRRQLGGWVLKHHPHDVVRRARELEGQHPRLEVLERLASVYGVDPRELEQTWVAAERSR